MGDDRTHLHARPFAAEGKPGADRQQSAKELDLDQTGRGRRQLTLQRRLDMGYAAAGSGWRKLPNQPGRQRNRRRTDEGHEQETGEALVMCRGNQRTAKAIRLFERQPENRADQPRCRAGYRRQQRQHEQAAIAFCRRAGRFRPILHGHTPVWRVAVASPASPTGRGSSGRSERGQGTAVRRPMGRFARRKPVLKWTSSPSPSYPCSGAQ